MTPRQTAFYFREWARVRAYYKERGLAGTELDGMRHKLHVKALGKDKSHTSFSNSDFDRVLGVFRAIYDDANLNAQLRQIEQPEHRRDDLVNRCWDAARVFIHGNDRGHTDALCDRYIHGVSERICKKPFRELDERELGKIFGALDRQARRAEEKQRREHAVKVAAEDRRRIENDEPF